MILVTTFLQEFIQLWNIAVKDHYLVFINIFKKGIQSRQAFFILIM